MIKNQVTFYPDTHKYFNSQGEEYISCTTLIHKFVPEFDKEKWSTLVARRDGKTPEQVQKEWEKTAKDATDYGTLIHNGIEFCIKTNPTPEKQNYSDMFCEMCEYVRKQFNVVDGDDWYRIINGWISVWSTLGSENITPEMLLWNHKYKIAGQSDIVQINHQKKLINVADHKTNKKIEFSSKYNEYMLSPVQHLSNCNYNTYSLQLSIYAYMLQQMYPDYNIGRLFINHLDRTNGWTIYPVPYMKLEAMCILREFEKQIVNN